MKAILIDDHPLIINAYRQALLKIAEDRKTHIDIQVKKDLEEATSLFKSDSDLLKNADIIFLDISLPLGKSKEFLSGEDLGIKIRKENSQIRIFVSTSLNDNFRMHSILRSIDPDGFVIKNDLTPIELIQAIENVLDNPPYYSQSVLQLLRKQISSDQILDDLDRRLLYELSMGTRMKDIPDVLPLSIAGVEKRKRNLKMIFNVEDQGDSGLIKVARAKGFI